MIELMAIGLLYVAGAVTHYSLISRTEQYLSTLHTTPDTNVTVRMSPLSKMGSSAIWPIMSVLLLLAEFSVDKDNI